MTPPAPLTKTAAETFGRRTRCSLRRTPIGNLADNSADNLADNLAGDPPGESRPIP